VLVRAPLAGSEAVTATCLPRRWFGGPEHWRWRSFWSGATGRAVRFAAATCWSRPASLGAPHDDCTSRR